MRSTILGLFFILVLATTAFAEERFITLATTTSTADTGLLDVLAPKFKEETGIELRFVSTGTGKALEMGKSCNADSLLVHDPEAEAAFVAAGHGIERVQVMYNDFVYVGPINKDAANAKGKTVMEALKAIETSKTPFISRGDKSGTHAMELRLWKEAGINADVKNGWYTEIGQGMMATLRVAAEKNGYTLTDRGTWIKFADANQDKSAPLTLEIKVEGDKVLFNQYSSMTVNPAQCKNTKVDDARAFTKWLVDANTQKFIAEYKLLGQPLFVPNAGK